VVVLIEGPPTKWTTAKNRSPYLGRIMSLWSVQIRHLKGSALSRTESKVAFFKYGSQSASHLDRTQSLWITCGQKWSVTSSRGITGRIRGHTATVESKQEGATYDHQTLHTVMHGVQGWIDYYGQKRGQNGL